MSQFKLFKNRQRFFLSLWNWLLLASLGFHTVLILYPNTLQQKPDITNTANTPKLEGIRVIELPSNRKVTAPNSSLKSNSQSLPLIDKNSGSSSNLSLNQPSNNNLESPSPSPEIQQEQSSFKSTSTEDFKSQNGSKKQDLDPDKIPSDPFTDFPKYPNSETGSFGLLQGNEDLASQQTRDRQDVVVLYFERELQARGYEIKILPNESKQKVYQIFKGGLNKFLNLIDREGQGTAIVLSSKPLELENLQTLSVARKAETDFDIVLKQLSELGAQRIAIPEFYFAQPEAFYAKSLKEHDSYDIDKPKFGFDGNFVVILDKKPEEVFSTFFTPNLQSKKFVISPMSNYGGGLIYKIKQDTFVRYLNLLPTQSGIGTIIVIWRSLPK